MEKIKYLILVLFFIVLIIFKNFQVSHECDWVITNCCPENAGARWECVNVKSYKPKLNCSEVQVICPQILSPKPNLKCVWENGKCVVK